MYFVFLCFYKNEINKKKKKKKGYLNIDYLYSKIDYLREICSKSAIDILCIYETNLDSSYLQ